MQLRPLAPLAVIGAGLLMMSLATRSASADDGGAPGEIVVASAPGSIVVSWAAPTGMSGLQDYDLLIADVASGKQVVERSVDAGTTKAVVDLGDLGGRTELAVSVTAEYDQGAHYPGQTVRVSLPGGPAQPDTAPALRAEGRMLRVALPAAPDGVTGRVVQLYRDGEAWTSVAVAAGKAVVTRKARAGHEYATAYQDVNATASGALSARSAAVRVGTGGPTAVKTVKLAVVADGLRVRWSRAQPQGADLVEYRVLVTKDGERVGSGYAAAGVREVVLPGAADDGAYAVIIVAEDAAGASSTSTATVVLSS